MKHAQLILTFLCINFFYTVFSQQKSDGIFYSSLNYAIQLGQYDGVATLHQVKQHGDFGVGSRHALTGELILLNGKAYQISVDGKAVIMPDTARLPFASVKFFKADKQYQLSKQYNLQQIQSFLDSIINTNLFSAIKITGDFSSIKYKCYYPQQKPYKSIKETPAAFFDSTAIKGTMAGFFTPESAIVLNSPNYHFHFLNSRGSSGGHVDDCIVSNVTIEIDYADQLIIKLPPTEFLKNIDLNKKIISD